MYVWELCVRWNYSEVAASEWYIQYEGGARVELCCLRKGGVARCTGLRGGLPVYFTLDSFCTSTCGRSAVWSE